MIDSDGRGRGALIIVAVVLVVAVLALVAWVAIPNAPDVSRPPPGVPMAEADGFVFAVGEMKLSERQIITTLDVPKGRFQGAWSAFERDPEARLWIRYGGQDHPAIVIQATPIRMPEGARIDRIVLIGFLDKTQEPPAPEQPVEAGLRVPAGLIRRSAPLTFTVKGVEKVLK